MPWASAIPEMVSPSWIVYWMGPAGGASVGAGVASGGGGHLGGRGGPEEAPGVSAEEWPRQCWDTTGRGRTAPDDSLGSDGGRINSQSARTLAMSSPNREARNAIPEGVALTGSRHSLQKGCAPAAGEESPWAAQ